MKDSLFNLFLNLVEKTLAQLKEKHSPEEKSVGASETLPPLTPLMTPPQLIRVQVEEFNTPKPTSIRVFTRHEQTKLTKASYQFLMRIASWGILSPETFELIINRLLFSNSRFVSLQETKWAIRNTLATGLDDTQLGFLELVLYQKENQFPSH